MAALRIYLDDTYGAISVQCSTKKESENALFLTNRASAEHAAQSANPNNS